MNKTRIGTPYCADHHLHGFPSIFNKGELNVEKHKIISIPTSGTS
ncbi:MAG: hypothetical protein WAM14_09610 [Candidatus Nitrosopolaris sp.]